MIERIIIHHNKYIKILLLYMIMICVWFIVLICNAGAEVGHESRKVEGVGVEIIRVNMGNKDNKVTILLSQDFPGGSESFYSMVKRSQSVAAVNGTFFCTQTFKPVGDIVIDGKLRNAGRFGIALAITPDNKVRFIRTPTGYSVDWSGYETVIACGPRLVKNGVAQVNAVSEGFKDSHVLGSATRSAIGLTGNNELLIISTHEGVTLDKLSHIMASLSCKEAMNLDGGASTAIAYHGKVLISPGRELTNIIAVYEKAPHVKLTEGVSITSDGDAGTSIQNAHIQFKTAMDLIRAGNYHKAEPYMNRACRLNPTAANYIHLAEIRKKIGDRAGAADAYAGSAGIYYDKAMFNEAVVNARRALALSPRHQNALRYYNLSQLKRGKPVAGSIPSINKPRYKNVILYIFGFTMIIVIVYFIGRKTGIFQ